MKPLLVLVILAACGSDSTSTPDATPPDAPALQGSCFLSCNTAIGLVWACKTDPTISSAPSCTAAAKTQCQNVERSEFVPSCELCNDACAPAWHKP